MFLPRNLGSKSFAINTQQNAFKFTNYVKGINSSGKLFYSTNPMIDKISTEVASNACVLFMKGIPSAPQCGFSNAVVQVLEMQRAKYKSFNVLDDNNLRDAIKKFSNWPTIPQLYIGGKFVGGCDITLDLHKSGELEKLLKEAKAIIQE